jgi:hypothetical protein
MNHIQAIIGNVDQVIASARPVFAAYIKDTSISLDDRWQAFTAANMALKDETTYGGLDLMFRGERISPYDDFYMDKYETCSGERLVIFLEENEHPEADIADFKEQLLKNNVGSFTFDW